MLNRFEIGKRIEKLCTESGMRRLVLARKAGITDESIRCWSDGMMIPSAKCLVGLSFAFNVSVEYILCLTDEKGSGPDKYVTTNMCDIGNRITRLCKERKLKYSAVARAIDADYSSLYEYRLGCSLPGPERLVRLSRVLGVTVDYLLGVEK